MSLIIMGARGISDPDEPVEGTMEHEELSGRRGIGLNGEAWHLDTETYNRIIGRQFYRGVFKTDADLLAAYPNDAAGAYAIVLSTQTFWIWGTSGWADTGYAATSMAGLPPGGSKTQVLTKASDLNNDVAWMDQESLTMPYHNDLHGLQGGASTERFHLTKAQHDVIESGEVDWDNIINIPEATPDDKGFLRIATVKEVLDGVDNTTAVSPYGLQAKIQSLPASSLSGDIVNALNNASTPSGNNPYATMDDLNNAIAAPVPAGGIIMWSGLITAIPAGWALCNGVNGTPDLRNKFIMGANGVTSNPGDGGGNNLLALSASNLPSHNHSASGGSHTHSMVHAHSMSGLTVGTSGAHTHSVVIAGNNFGSGSSTVFDRIENRGYTNFYNTAASSGAHTHTIMGSISSYSGITDSSSPTVSVGYTGNSVAFDNRPEYYVLAYIIKL